MPKPYSTASEVFEQERLLRRLRTERDAAAATGDHGLALITKSTFDVLNPHDGIVAVIDRDEGMSVTNDVENVVHALAHYGHLGSGDRLIYQDTTGRWDEIVHSGGAFIGFRPIGAKTMEDACRALEGK